MMKALVFENSWLRLAATKLLSLFTPSAFVGALSPMQLRDIPEPRLPADDWVVIRTRLCGLCGSDYKQVFLNGGIDNPMTAMISFPQVLGHEVVGVIDQIGPRVTGLEIGQRVVLNPWLSCAPRGLPLCEWCLRGDLAQCANFRNGALEPGIHTGNSRDATGGFAPRLPAHESMCIAIPDDIPDEVAVLADPFAVSLHAIGQHPPPDDAFVLVYGCGTLGLAAISILRALHPSAKIFAVARFPHQRELAEKQGAHRVFEHTPHRALIEQIAAETEAELLEPWRGLPMLGGGVHTVYDTVTSPGTLEVGVRVTRSRGTIVALGVETPKRFEWTPLYFKELSLVGSNAFGMETFDGRRMHAIEWYFELIATHQIDITPIISHRFALADYREAFLICHDQGRHRAVKVLFEYGEKSGSPLEAAVGAG
jgi:threonine dehydrogenase-like Zn-dependent dehydrogenase